MRIAFVHGINNQFNDAESIRRDWWAALEEAWDGADLPAKAKPQIDVGYYGKLLDDDAGNDVVEMGESAAATGLAKGLLMEYAREAGLSQAELDAIAAELEIEPEAIAQGFPLQGAVVRLVSILERGLPTKGKYVSKLFLKQAIKYINDKALAARIDREVRRAILDDHDDSVIVIAHSLGTVVSYRVLADNAANIRKVPLFVTLGSPLSVRMFRKILPTTATFPKPPIEKWLNARNAEDFVTLARPINLGSIGFDGVVDHAEVRTKKWDVHDVGEYLRDPKVAREIYDALP